MRRSSLATLAALTIAPLAAIPAHADQCYDQVGCVSREFIAKSSLAPMSCQLLWNVRNQIYKDRGYCFKTATGINEMGNDGCYINDQSAVPLNDFERVNVLKIRSVETAKGCNYGG